MVYAQETIVAVLRHVLQDYDSHVCVCGNCLGANFARSVENVIKICGLCGVIFPPRSYTFMSDRVVVSFVDPICCLVTSVRRMIRLIARLGRRSQRQLTYLTFHHSYATPGNVLTLGPVQRSLGVHNMSVEDKTTPQTSAPGCKEEEDPKVNRPPSASSRPGVPAFSRFLPHGWVQRASGGDFKFKGGGEGHRGRKSPSKTQRQAGHTGHRGDTGDSVTGSHGKPGGGRTHVEAPQKKRARVNSSGDVQNKEPASPNKGQESPIHHGPTGLSESSEKKQASSQEDHAPTRGWYHTPTYGHHKRKPGPAGFDFSVMSYNVLAQELLTANWYLYLDCADQEVLAWGVRKEKLLQEFQHYNVDVLCLQEVQESHYHDFFLPELQKLGYEGLYKKRTGDKPDGCATFYRTSKFHLVKHRLVEYYRPGTDVLDRDNVAVVVLLKPKTDKRKLHTNLCIANTHLLFNKRRGDVKLSQLGVLLAEIDQLAFDPKVRYWDAKVRCHPVVLCGDLNSAPFSPLYQFVNGGRLAYSDYERSEISGQSSPPRWRNWMRPPLWPPFVGITDHCQYHHAVLERRQQAVSRHEEQGVSVTPTSGVSSIEDPVQCDNDAPIPSPLSVSSDAQSNPDDLPEPVEHEAEQGSWHETVEPPSVPSDNFSASETVVAEGGCQNLPSLSDPTVSAAPPQVPPFSSCIFHPFNLRSVYSHFTEDHQPEATTHHGRANCTVDYIFYTARHFDSKFGGDHAGQGRRQRPKYRDGKLKLLSRLSLPSDRELEKTGSLPNKEHPSDHLPLIAKFRLTDK